MKKGWKNYDFSVWRKKDLGDLITIFEYLKGDYEEDEDTIVSVAVGNRIMSNSLTLQ